MAFRRTWRRVAAILIALVLVVFAGYAVYVGFVGSDQLIHPAGNTDCRTPLVRYGWPYEAINYEIADLGRPDLDGIGLLLLPHSAPYSWLSIWARCRRPLKST